MLYCLLNNCLQSNSNTKEIKCLHIIVITSSSANFKPSARVSHGNKIHSSLFHNNNYKCIPQIKQCLPHRFALLHCNVTIICTYYERAHSYQKASKLQVSFYFHTTIRTIQREKLIRMLLSQLKSTFSIKYRYNINYNYETLSFRKAYKIYIIHWISIYSLIINSKKIPYPLLARIIPSKLKSRNNSFY